MSPITHLPFPAKAALIVLSLITAALLMIGCALIIALAGLRRLTPSLDPSDVVVWAWHFRADPQLRQWFGIGLLAAFAVFSLFTFAMLRKSTPLHGAARWASEAEVAAAGLRHPTGIILGRRAGRLLVFGGEEHVLLAAPTRSGKGVGVVIPNLLNWPDSTVVLDVKRENWRASAGFRAAAAQQVILFDPFDPEGRTARFNPLGHVPRHDPFRVIDELQKIAGMLFPTPDNADPFWAEAARTGFIGVGALVAQLQEQTFSLGSIYAELTRGDPRRRLPATVQARADSGNPVWPSCAQALADFCSASDNTFASIKQTITAKMGLWIHPQVCAATEVSDFQLEDLRRRRMSIYLGASPDNLSRLAPLYNLFFQQLVDLNTRQPPQGDEPYQVLVILDEFARLGPAKVLAHAFSYAAGYGLRLMPVLQSTAQLRGLYGSDLAEEIIANCGAEVIFTPKDIQVARNLSERLGQYGLTTRTRSRPAGLSSGRRSLSESSQRRPLMLPQELLLMSQADMLVLRGGVAPIRAKKVVYWREQAFLSRVLPPPIVPPIAKGQASAAIEEPDETLGDSGRDEIEDICDALSEGGYDPPPPSHADEETWRRWSLKYLDQAYGRTPRRAHGRD
ncbi:type IV secretory system conjugative DNA transfer family protein [Phenylobacterium sp.]|uniref:type IV secretory system conjugative DNA transfer family protein n=1 Tax=Phenylobacterium sp. TaxID=1871053 RepID=UPI00272FB847|nr:type IV secretory system conjugative DNA transfer family protein [Phenylobacterium sp.]MDP1875182.1 type IV secretory system conjugative DNA transfer family protein [Phenylobacterium sp.]